jgi:hypothetical protein
MPEEKKSKEKMDAGKITIDWFPKLVMKASKNLIIANQPWCSSHDDAGMDACYID